MAIQRTDSLPASILVADDDRTQCAIIAAAAAPLGHGVVNAHSVDEASTRLSERAFRTVIVDLSIGERDGIELLRAIATLRPVPRVIIISGCEERILNAALRYAHASGIAGAEALSKPISIRRLRDLLGSAQEIRQESADLATAPPVTADAIARGLRNGEIYPVFQPKIELATGRLAGCEALARWTSTELGVVGPSDFIALAEASGLVGDVTRSILQASVASVRRFLPRNPDFVLAVNVSAALLSDISLPDEVERLLAENGLPAGALLLEITESVAMSDIARAIDVLVRLRIKGVGLAIDDFGTGYSSLSALARMPFSELKIDQSFVRGSLNDPDLMKIVRGSVALAHEFGMKTVAEGIEDEATRVAMQRIGCDLGQGYLFSGPLAVEPFEDWIRQWCSGQRRARTPAA